LGILTAQLSATTLVSVDGYSSFGVREWAQESVDEKLAGYIEAGGWRQVESKPIEYVWTHSDSFELYHDLAASDVYGSVNYPRPIWLLRAVVLVARR
jgi:hypothetical protein